MTATTTTGTTTIAGTAVRVTRAVPGGSAAPGAFDHGGPAAGRDRPEGAVEGLFARARAAGRLRPGADAGDPPTAPPRFTRPLPGTACPVDDRFVRRRLHLRRRPLLDGPEAPGRSELPEAPAASGDPWRGRP
ncbi:hypothetical protein [Streptomyces somaliensis]|uniref:Uncharacterized protein n=1 Tax=Streptomyces somaliensis (strain ATCC 33201 / DSM 40738 / JCM 12659 / KCTC 9044 / NCTC 11332 / NRRL B-12077 / IP 733) TaxID=1134445 RepID=A0AA44DAQ7_STRE0|nr:hypothetical protein [Streptomyces somaliensis]NKY13262.1 hypothetical protein [Streptomyces somaliensis DSM 40738]